MSEQAAIMLDPALASAVEKMATPSTEELQQKLDVLRKLEADVERFDTAKQRAEASAARARKRHKSACAARDAAARDLAITARLAGVEIRAIITDEDSGSGAAPGAASAAAGDASAAAWTRQQEHPGSVPGTEPATGDGGREAGVDGRISPSA